MQNRWKDCKKILIVRPDNMGDILMSTPAIQAVKITFNCHITLLTSSMGKPITSLIPCIDDTIEFNLPWVKQDGKFSDNIYHIINEISARHFDGAIIFNVYSQNPVPSIMLAYMANIPLRLAYCRENLYYLLTDWLPDKEPYTYIVHQVKRDVTLVESIGAKSLNNNLVLQPDDTKWDKLKLKLSNYGVEIDKKWIVAHAGVSEEKRYYPKENWIELSKTIIAELDCQLLFTGANSDIQINEFLVKSIGTGAIDLAGLLNVDEFILLIKNTSLIISVNTVTAHIAAATNTPIIVLYALTNPQHLPWKAKGKVFAYQVPKHLQSKNEIIKYVAENLHSKVPDMCQPNEVFKEIINICKLNTIHDIPELIN